MGPRPNGHLGTGGFLNRGRMHKVRPNDLILAQMAEAALRNPPSSAYEQMEQWIYQAIATPNANQPYGICAVIDPARIPAFTLLTDSDRTILAWMMRNFFFTTHQGEGLDGSFGFHPERCFITDANNQLRTPCKVDVLHTTPGAGLCTFTNLCIAPGANGMGTLTLYALRSPAAPQPWAYSLYNEQEGSIVYTCEQMVNASLAEKIIDAKDISAVAIGGTDVTVTAYTTLDDCTGMYVAVVTQNGAIGGDYWIYQPRSTFTFALP